MLENIILEDVLVFDIETVPQQENLADFPDEMHGLWDEKVGRFRDDGVDEQEYYFSKAGIHAEFGKVVCISAGFFKTIDGKLSLRVKSFFSDDEKQLLTEFADMLDRFFKNPNKYYLCGHNIKEFDVPYLCRRMLIHGIKLPNLLDLAGKKPWEVKHLDTMELWKFGDYKKYTALKLLTAIFGIPTPKDDIDGSQVGSVYWHESDLERIATYCSKDVLAVAQLLMRYRGAPLLDEANVTFV